MNRGVGSQFGRSGFHSQAGEINRQARVLPSDRPPFVVTAIEASTYSTAARSALAGSTSVSPPSPPNGETIVRRSGRSSPVPLSCMPPQMLVPWPRGERPVSA
jgi:hypothetical protein